MTEHKIGWLNMPGYKPETWNPIVGCSKVSPGCDNCYAERMANRLTYALGGVGTGKNQDAWIAYSDVISKGKWNGKTALIKSQLTKPSGWKTPRMIFVCSMSDLFHESVPFEWLLKVFIRIQENPQHLFIVLTKRPEIMAEKIKRFYNVSPNILSDYASLPNLWIGVTAENQEQANKRIPILLQIPAAKRFVSIEPMLGPIDFYDIVINTEFYHTLKGFGDISGGDFGLVNGPKLDWVICGGESGNKARPMHPDWVRSLRDQCKAAGTPFFFKQWGTWRPLTTTKLIEKLPFGDYRPDIKFGYVKKSKHMIGATIDNQEYHEWPQLETLNLKPETV